MKAFAAVLLLVSLIKISQSLLFTDAPCADQFVKHKGCLRDTLDDIDSKFKKNKIDFEKIKIAVDQCLAAEGCRLPFTENTANIGFPSGFLPFDSTGRAGTLECAAKLMNKTAPQTELCIKGKFNWYNKTDKPVNMELVQMRKVLYGPTVTIYINRLCKPSVREFTKKCISDAYDANGLKTSDFDSMKSSICTARDKCVSKLNATCLAGLKNVTAKACECVKASVKGNGYSILDDITSCAANRTGRKFVTLPDYIKTIILQRYDDYNCTDSYLEKYDPCNPPSLTGSTTSFGGSTSTTGRGFSNTGDYTYKRGSTSTSTYATTTKRGFISSIFGRKKRMFNVFQD